MPPIVGNVLPIGQTPFQIQAPNVGPSVPNPLDVTNFFRMVQTAQNQRGLNLQEQQLELRRQEFDEQIRQNRIDEINSILNFGMQGVAATTRQAKSNASDFGNGIVLDPTIPAHAAAQNKLLELQEEMSQGYYNLLTSSDDKKEVARQASNIGGEYRKKLNSLGVGELSAHHQRYLQFVDGVEKSIARGDKINNYEFERIQNSYTDYLNKKAAGEDASLPFTLFDPRRVAFDPDTTLTGIRETLKAAYTPFEEVSPQTAEELGIPKDGVYEVKRRRVLPLEDGVAITYASYGNDPNFNAIIDNSLAARGIDPRSLSPENREVYKQQFIRDLAGAERGASKIMNDGTITDVQELIEPSEVSASKLSETERLQLQQNRDIQLDLSNLGYDPSALSNTQVRDVANTMARSGGNLGRLYEAAEIKVLRDQGFNGIVVARNPGGSGAYIVELRSIPDKSMPGDESKGISGGFIPQEPRIIGEIPLRSDTSPSVGTIGAFESLEKYESNGDLVNPNDSGQATVGPHGFRGQMGNEFLKSLGVKGFDLTRPLSPDEETLLQNRLTEIPNVTVRSREFWNANILPNLNEALTNFAPSVPLNDVTSIALYSLATNHSPQGQEQILRQVENAAQGRDLSDLEFVDLIQNVRKQYVSNLDPLTRTSLQARYDNELADAENLFESMTRSAGRARVIPPTLEDKFVSGEEVSSQEAGQILRRSRSLTPELDSLRTELQRLDGEIFSAERKGDFTRAEQLEREQAALEESLISDPQFINNVLRENVSDADLTRGANKFLDQINEDIEVDGSSQAEGFTVTRGRDGSYRVTWPDGTKNAYSREEFVAQLKNNLPIDVVASARRRSSGDVAAYQSLPNLSIPVARLAVGPGLFDPRQLKTKPGVSAEGVSDTLLTVLSSWPSDFTGVVISDLGRTPEQNAAVDGAESSFHLTGDAIDIRTKTDLPGGTSGRAFAQWLTTAPGKNWLNEVGYEGGIHDRGGKNEHLHLEPRQRGTIQAPIQNVVVPGNPFLNYGNR